MNALRISEIVLVAATLIQAAGAFSFIITNRRWQRNLLFERDAERKQFEVRVGELEARVATANAACSPASPEAAPKRADRSEAWTRAAHQPAKRPAAPAKQHAAVSLTPDNMQILVARLADVAPMHVEILLSAEAARGETLAEQLRITLGEAKWTVDRVVPDLATAEPRGLALMVPDWNAAPPGARVLADTLRRLGFHVIEMDGGDTRVGVLSIFIGPDC